MPKCEDTSPCSREPLVEKLRISIADAGGETILRRSTFHSVTV